VILPAAPTMTEQVKALLHGEDNHRLLHALLPVDLPELSALAWLAPGSSGLAYLPSWWLELR
jgi:hypothetical protein